MSRRFVVVLALVFFLLLLATGIYFTQRGYQPRTFALAITGDAGREVVGYVIVDGVKQRIEGTLPLNLPYQGRKIEYAIAPTISDLTKSISLVITIDGKVWGSATVGAVKGSIEHGGFPSFFGGGDSGYIGGMSDAEIAELNKK